MEARARSARRLGRRRGSAAWWLGWTLVACDDGGFRLSVAFDPPALAEIADRVVLTVTDRCDTPAPPGARTVTLERNARAPTLGDVAVGSAIVVQAFRGACDLGFGRGCAPVTEAGIVTVLVQPEYPTTECLAPSDTGATPYITALPTLDTRLSAPFPPFYGVPRLARRAGVLYASATRTVGQSARRGTAVFSKTDSGPWAEVLSAISGETGSIVVDSSDTARLIYTECPIDCDADARLVERAIDTDRAAEDPTPIADAVTGEPAPTSVGGARLSPLGDLVVVAGDEASTQFLLKSGDAAWRRHAALVPGPSEEFDAPIVDYDADGSLVGYHAVYRSSPEAVVMSLFHERGTTFEVTEQFSVIGTEHPRVQELWVDSTGARHLVTGFSSEPNSTTWSYRVLLPDGTRARDERWRGSDFERMGSIVHVVSDEAPVFIASDSRGLVAFRAGPTPPEVIPLEGVLATGDYILRRPNAIAPEGDDRVELLMEGLVLELVATVYLRLSKQELLALVGG